MKVCNTPWASSNSAGVLRLFGACYPLMSAARSQARKGYIRFDVLVQSGDRWATRGVVRGASPRLPRDEVVVLDVSDVPGDRLRLRLPLAAGYWRIGNVRIDYSCDLPVKVFEIEPSEAVDRQGRDILDLLRADDDLDYVTETGDEATVSFPEPPQRPAPPAPSSLEPAGTTQFTDSDGEGRPAVRRSSRVQSPRRCCSRLTEMHGEVDRTGRRAARRIAAPSSRTLGRPS